MCGILATISKNTLGPNRKIFLSALKKQKYRGPDLTKISKISNNTYFGFNRLTIQDLSVASMQPFQYENNFLIFNGEIYNWKELKRDLIKNGVKFKTHGDTEVLAAGLSLEGSNFIKKLNGIFAFCFYDATSETHLLARDLMGIKPLFYTETHKELIISTDVNSIINYIPKPQINYKTIETSLMLDPFTGQNLEETFFTGVHALKRGHFMLLDKYANFIKNEKYESIDFITDKRDFASAEKKFPNLLKQVFNIETRSDTKVGIVLSGGIDSTTIAIYAIPILLKKQKEVPIYTFYYDSMGEKTDLEYSARIVETLNKKYKNKIKLKPINMDSSLMAKDFIDATLSRATPVLDVRNISLLNMYRKIRKDKIKVILNGQGSDEIFYGYYPLDYWVSKFYRNGTFTTEEILKYYKYDLNSKRVSIYKKSFVDNATEESRDYLNHIFKNMEKTKYQQKKITSFFIDTALNGIFRHEDASSMYSSIEVRVPLINKILTHFISQYNYKVNLLSTTSGRHLLRTSIKGAVPDDIIMRPKSPTPKKKNYFNELYEIYKEYKTEIQESPLINSIYIKKFIENPKILQRKGSDYAYYGNEDDVLFEFLGIFFFDKVYFMNKIKI
jgi:asparagine synthase (glutamine-hydrolysing)